MQFLSKLISLIRFESKEYVFVTSYKPKQFLKIVSKYDSFFSKTVFIDNGFVEKRFWVYCRLKKNRIRLGVRLMWQRNSSPRHFFGEIVEKNGKTLIRGKIRLSALMSIVLVGSPLLAVFFSFLTPAGKEQMSPLSIFLFVAGILFVTIGLPEAFNHTEEWITFFMKQYFRASLNRSIGKKK